MTMSKRLDKLADELFYCLPANSVDDLFSKLSERVGGGIKRRAVEETIRYVRRNCERIGWTIPHVKRGKASSGRFIRILIEKGGPTVFDRDGDRGKLEDGLRGTVMHVAVMTKNEANALRAAANHSSNRAYANNLESMAEDLEAVSKKAVRVAKILKFAS